MIRHYLGFEIYGSGDKYAALRHGVRLSANSHSLLITMIENHVKDRREWFERKRV